MIWELVKRDPAWKMMPYFSVISAVVWGVGSASSSEALSTISAVMAMGLIGAYRGFSQRYTPLHATLPIAGKQLFLSRVLSLLGFIWTPILAAFAATAVRGGKGILDNRPALLALGAIITLALMLIQCVRVNRINPPGWLMITVFVIAAASAPIVGLLLPDSSFAVIASVVGGCLVASAALFVKGWAEVPKCFQLAPAGLERAERSATQDPSRSEAAQATPWWPVLRAVYFSNSRTSGWLLIMVLVQALIFGGVFAVFVALYIPMLYFEYRNKLRWLLHLPISSRKLEWVAWGPTAAVILLGLMLNSGMNALGMSALLSVDEAAVYTRANADESGTSNIRVPAGYWHWARGGSVPAIEAPWGERYQPESRGWRSFVVYNPYSVGRENSQRFLEWQFARATAAVYGQAIPISQAGSLQRMKTRMQRGRAQIVIATLVLLYLLIQMCTLHLAGWRGIRNTPVGFRLLVAVAPVVPLSPAVSAFAIPGGGSYGLESLALRISDTPPDQLWILGLAGVAVIAGLYWLADKLWIENEFGQIEMLARMQTTGRY